MPFLPDEINKTATTQLGYNANIIIGGSDPTKLIPNANCSFQRKATDEFFININAENVAVSGSENITLSADLVQLETLDRKDHYYITDDDNLEYEIIFDKKPASPIIPLKIKCSQGLFFAYQPDTTPEEIEWGKLVGAEIKRPEHLINSYAVYCAKANGKYKTGKICHIERAWVKDKTGKKSWCEQNINIANGVGVWEIAIPDAIYNDKTLYPLTVGPSLGYDVLGGTPGLTNSTYTLACHGTMTEDGTGVAMYFYSNATIVKMALYSDNGLVYPADHPNIVLAGNAQTTNGDGSIVSLAMTPNLTSGTKYWVAVCTDHDTTNKSFYYDIIAQFNLAMNTSGGYFYTMPDPWVNNLARQKWVISLWLEYAGPLQEITPPAATINGSGVAPEPAVGRFITPPVATINGSGVAPGVAGNIGPFIHPPSATITDAEFESRITGGQWSTKITDAEFESKITEKW